MSLLSVLRMGDPVLRRVADPVLDPTDPAIAALAERMTEAMIAAPGVGLAADRAAAADAPEPERILALVNPEFEPLGPETELGWEGCLSVPDLRGVVPRYARIGYRGWLPDGTRVEAEAMGFQARILQHETDHLDGYLYLDRMRDFQTLGYSEEILAAAKAAADRAGARESESL
jgi:peptide deformylase